MTDSPMIPVYLGWFPAEAVATAIEIERALTAGRAIGLTEAQTREVIDEWLARTPNVVPWQRIHDAMYYRALGLEWKP